MSFLHVLTAVVWHYLGNHAGDYVAGSEIDLRSTISRFLQADDAHRRSSQCLHMLTCYISIHLSKNEVALHCSLHWSLHSFDETLLSLIRLGIFCGFDFGRIDYFLTWFSIRSLKLDTLYRRLFGWVSFISHGNCAFLPALHFSKVLAFEPLWPLGTRLVRFEISSTVASAIRWSCDIHSAILPFDCWLGCFPFCSLRVSSTAVSDLDRSHARGHAPHAYYRTCSVKPQKVFGLSSSLFLFSLSTENGW